MPHRRRIDEPGMLHHIYNRGVARRTVFETRRDVRKFLALLAREQRKGRIELLAFAFLTTHYHLIARSCTGELPAVMQRVVNQYVRYFNRTRRRDGPLFRSRYQSKPILSNRYLWTLVRYIDQNAVEARVASSGATYPYGSATHYVSLRRPRWLSTGVIDAMMGSPTPEGRLKAYGETFGQPLTAGDARIVKRRLASRATAADEWDELIGAAPPRVLDWMRRKARLADGTTPGMPYVDAAAVDRVLRIERAAVGDWMEKIGSQRRDAWPVARVGLLRGLAGMTLSETKQHCELARCAVRRRIAQHATLLEASNDYARRVADLAAKCLRPD